MAASYTVMAQALTDHMTELAPLVQALTGSEAQVHGLPDPTMDRHVLWLDVPGPSVKEGVGLDGLDENFVAVQVCVSVPYQVQEDRPLVAFEICDLLNERFPDGMNDDVDLRLTRVRSIQPQREQWGDTSSAVQLTVRARLDVPVFTRR